MATGEGEDVWVGTVLDGRLCMLLAYCIGTIWVNPWRCAAAPVQKFGQWLHSLCLLDDTVFNLRPPPQCLLYRSLYKPKDFIWGLMQLSMKSLRCASLLWNIIWFGNEVLIGIAETIKLEFITKAKVLFAVLCASVHLEVIHTVNVEKCKQMHAYTNTYACMYQYIHRWINGLSWQFIHVMSFSIFWASLIQQSSMSHDVSKIITCCFWKLSYCQC